MPTDSSNYCHLRVQALKHAYDDREVLDIPDLSFEKGRIYALVGPNGAGKSTLMLILALLLKPTFGKIHYQGVEVTDANRRELRKRSSMLLQAPLLFRTTVVKNVEYGLKIRGIGRPERKKKAIQSLKMVGLEGFMRRRGRELSGGEAQRVAIARALAIQPELLLFDELTANVDEANVAGVEAIIRSLSEESGITIIFSTHDRNQAHRLAHEIITLLEGRIAPLSPDNIFKGRTVKDADGTWFDTGKIRVFLPDGDEARAISINPEEILISISPFNSSARNCIEGVIESISADGAAVRLLIDAQERFHVLITRKSLCDMGLTVGMRVYLTFKSSAVQVF